MPDVCSGDPRGVMLKPMKGTFVPSELRESLTDLLFEAVLPRVLKGTPRLFVYLLFEHKSAPDASTVLQLLGYLTKIWEPYRIRRAARLPHILPIIVYQGRTRWSVPQSFDEYFSQTSALGVDPQFRPLLLDLGRIREELLARQSAVTRSALAAMRFAANHTLPRLHAALIAEVVESSSPAVTDYFRGLVTYLLEISTPEVEGAILKAVGTPAAREVIVTIADKLRNEGTLADRREVLIRLIEKKFGLTEEERSLIGTIDDLDRLAAALDEILFADSKQQVLEELRS